MILNVSHSNILLYKYLKYSKMYRMKISNLGKSIIFLNYYLLIYYVFYELRLYGRQIVQYQLFNQLQIRVDWLFVINCSNMLYTLFIRKHNIYNYETVKYYH